MKILYYDCFAGISGDMNLAAMIDLGVDADHLSSELSKLPVTGYTLKITKDQRHGIQGTKVEVELEGKEKHAHRNLHDVESIIEKSSLKKSIKDTSKAIFRRLAEAEAKVHRKSIKDIHFHEVGAVDAIVDIVGAAICYDSLKPDKVMASVIELGGGFARCSHGNLPVPAPATVEILKGIPVKKGSATFETTTPTGAAIIATLTEEFNDQVSTSIDHIGYGIGHKESDELPNVLRVFMGEVTEEEGLTSEIVHECNIDDMNPEWYDHLMDELFQAGAKEVFFTPVMMKKNRPAVKITVLASSHLSDAIKSIIYSNTTTLGIRSYTVIKDALERKFIPVETEWGKVTVKASYYRGRLLHAKPEYEECRRIANEVGVPLQVVCNKINSIIERSGIGE